VVGGGTLDGVTLAGGTLEVDSGVNLGAGLINFTSSGGTLQLDDSQHFGGKIKGLATSVQVIDLVDIAFSSSGTTIGYSGNTLSGHAHGE